MPICLGKDSWPELVGFPGEEAAKIIEKENPFVHAIIVREGDPITGDFRCDRVFVVVNDDGIVVRTPMIF